MTRSDEPLFEPRIADWLEDDPHAAPDQALDVVLAAFPSIKQRRAWRVPWRVPGMTTPLRLGLDGGGRRGPGHRVTVGRQPRAERTRRSRRTDAVGHARTDASPSPYSPSTSDLLDIEHLDGVHVAAIRLQHQPPGRLDGAARQTRLAVPAPTATCSTASTGADARHVAQRRLDAAWSVGATPG